MENKKEIENLVEIFNANNLNELSYDCENFSLTLVKDGGEIKTVSTIESTPAPQVEKIDYSNEIVSPIVGTFYKSPAPEKAAYVKIGDNVVEGQVVCIVEAMKVMNEITATTSGVVSEILVNDGDGVEFNQPLFRIK